MRIAAGHGGRVDQGGNMKEMSGTEGTLAELADPEFAIEPQWIVWAGAEGALSQRTAAELSNEPQWIVWEDPAREEQWAEEELGHLIGPHQ